MNNSNQISFPGLYIHFPFCKNKCNYCSFYSIPEDRSVYVSYLEAVFRDLEWILRETNGKPDTLYFGGGTPSLFPIHDLEKILGILSKRCTFSEITLEANPATMELDTLKSYKRMGINRLSLGIQSLKDEVLKFLGRIHSAKQAWESLEWTSQYFENFSVDFIYAIPGFPREYLTESVMSVVETFHPPHISAYCLSIEPDTPFYAKDMVTDEQQFCQEYTFLHEYLESQGYIHYEVSNFARKNCKSLHNTKYWNRTPYLGIGPAAHSLWEEKRFCFEDFQDFFENSFGQKYKKSFPLSTEEIRGEYVMLGARTQEGIESKWLLHPLDFYQEMFENQWIRQENSRIVVTWKGWMILNSIILALEREKS